MDKNRFNAIHEVGHATLALHFGFTFSYITIEKGRILHPNQQATNEKTELSEKLAAAEGCIKVIVYKAEDIQEFKCMPYYNYRKARQMIKNSMQVLAAGYTATGIAENGNGTLPNFSLDKCLNSTGRYDYEEAIALGESLFRKKTLYTALASAHFESGYILLKYWDFVMEMADILENKGTVKEEEIKKIWKNEK